MRNKIILGIVGIAVLAGIIFFASKSDTPDRKKSGVYCSSDGTPTGTMPIQSHRSYCIQSDAAGKTYSANMPSEYSFLIVDDRGKTLKDFEITHTKLMHLIVVRKDLKYFQHVHPEFDKATGIFTLKALTFRENGAYRIFADFAAGGGQKDPKGVPLAITISEDVAVGSDYKPEAIGTEERTKTFDGYQVTLAMQGTPTSGVENMLMFSISQNGKPITDLQEYLGALGHSVILKEGALDFIHAHPVETGVQNGTVSFMVNFAEAGKYKVFTQFQRSGRVFTTDFVVAVNQGSSHSENMMEGMEHSER